MTVIGLPLMLLPGAVWVSRYFFTKLAAGCDRSLSQSSMPSSSTEKTTRLLLLGCVAAQAALIALMIGPSGTRFRAFGSVGDWPCLAEMMIAVLLARWSVLMCATIMPSSPSSQLSARVSSGPGIRPPARYPPVSPSDLGSFCAVEIVWKFMPKIAGVPTWCVRLWSNPSISFRIACTLYPSYAMVAALSVVQSLPAPYVEAGSAWLLISGVKKSSTPLPDGPSNIWYAGCLSDQAVRSPASCATLKIVLTFRYWFG